jgi:hypothetical protein
MDAHDKDLIVNTLQERLHVGQAFHPDWQAGKPDLQHFFWRSRRATVMMSPATKSHAPPSDGIAHE